MFTSGLCVLGRSAIFYHDEEQKQVAERVKAEVQQLRYPNKPIVTEIVPAGKWWDAEVGPPWVPL
jgi:peptide methionine sulfoxide reductase MsrA